MTIFGLIYDAFRYDFNKHMYNVAIQLIRREQRVKKVKKIKNPFCKLVRVFRKTFK